MGGLTLPEALQEGRRVGPSLETVSLTGASQARALGAPAGAVGGSSGPGRDRRLQRPRRASPLPRGYLRGPAGRGEVDQAKGRRGWTGLQTPPFHSEKPDWRRGLPTAGPGGSLMWRTEGMETLPPKPSSPLPTGLLPQSLVSSPPQEHGILLSIVALGRTLRGAVAGGRRGALEKAAWTVAVRTEAVMRRHCRKLRQVRVPTRSHGRGLPSQGPDRSWGEGRVGTMPTP